MNNCAAIRNSTHICLGVCTYQRPEMLLRCLLSIRRLKEPPGTRLSVVVVDNEPQPVSGALVDSFSSNGNAQPFHYVHEPRRGIPQARNAVLDKARALGADWIAMLDDDQLVGDDWLFWMWWSAEQTSADVVYGAVERLLPEPLPAWAFEGPPRHRWKYDMQWVPTNGVLFRAGLSDACARPLRFDESLALTGGEDRDFFGRAYDGDAKIIQTPQAVAQEIVPASKLTFRAQISRVYAESVVTTGRDPSNAWKLPRTLIRGTLALASAPIAWLYARRTGRRQLLKGAKHLARVAGMAVALWPWAPTPEIYRTIHGS